MATLAAVILAALHSLSPPPGDAPTLVVQLEGNSSWAPLRIKLRADIAPQTVASITAALGAGMACERCATIYRNEAVPSTPPASCGAIGPCGPYSLVQGRLGLLEGTPAESQPLVERGLVARIGAGPDFFVAIAGHEDWGHAFTVWGDMRDDEAGMRTLEELTRMPWHEVTSGQTVMRMLDVELAADVRLPDEAAPEPSEGDSHDEL